MLINSLPIERYEVSEKKTSDNRIEASILKDPLTSVEDEILQKKPKSKVKLIYTVIAISLFFAAFNLTIFYKTILLSLFLCSPNVFSCDTNPSQSGIANAMNLIIVVSSTIAFMIALVVRGAICDDIRSRFGNRAPMILLGAIIAGLGFALAPDYALISELFTKEERGWVGLGFAGIGLGRTLIGIGLKDVSKFNTYQAWVLTG